jgi:hypothetical protein
LNNLQSLIFFLLALALLPHMACASDEKLVELNFPSDISYGKLYKVTPANGDQGYMLKTAGQPFAVARGKVQLPEGCNMAQLELSYAAAQHLDALKNVGHSLVGLSVLLDDFDDGALLKIGAMPQLRYLNITDNDITDKGLMAIGKLTNVQMLFANSLEITGAGVMKTAWPQSLTILSLGTNKLGDDCMQKFVGLKNLRHVCVGRASLTDAGAKLLAQNHNITNIEIPDNNITDKGVAYFAAMPKLQHLDITHTSVTDRSLTELQNVKTLHSVRLSPRNFSPEAMAKFRKARPNCILEAIGPRAEPELFRPLH